MNAPKALFSILVLILYFGGQLRAANKPRSSLLEIKAVFDHSNERGIGYNCEIINVSSSSQQFALWSCSYYENWVSDQKSIVIPAWTCN